MSYNGGSTLVNGSWMGRSDEDWTFSVKSLFGEDGFRDAKEFHAYCDAVDRMRAFAHNWFACDERAKPRVENLVIDALVQMGSIETGKSSKLMQVIRDVRGWPTAFVEALSQGQVAGVGVGTRAVQNRTLRSNGP